MQNIKDRLSNYANEKKPSRRDKNLVAFLAVKEEVAEALATGYTMRLIWELYFYKEKKFRLGMTFFVSMSLNNFKFKRASL